MPGARSRRLAGCVPHRAGRAARAGPRRRRVRLAGVSQYRRTSASAWRFVIGTRLTSSSIASCGRHAAGVQADVEVHLHRVPQHADQVQQPGLQARVVALVGHELLRIQGPAVHREGRGEAPAHLGGELRARAAARAGRATPRAPPPRGRGASRCPTRSPVSTRRPGSSGSVRSERSSMKSSARVISSSYMAPSAEASARLGQQPLRDLAPGARRVDAAGQRLELRLELIPQVQPVAPELRRTGQQGMLEAEPALELLLARRERLRVAARASCAGSAPAPNDLSADSAPTVAASRLSLSSGARRL